MGSRVLGFTQDLWDDSVRPRTPPCRQRSPPRSPRRSPTLPGCRRGDPRRRPRPVRRRCRVRVRARPHPRRLRAPPRGRCRRAIREWSRLVDQGDALRPGLAARRRGNWEPHAQRARGRVARQPVRLACRTSRGGRLQVINCSPSVQIVLPCAHRSARRAPRASRPPTRASSPARAPHRGLLVGLGVVPAADVQHAVDDEQPQLVARVPSATSPVWPPWPSSACAIARSTETTMSPRCGRAPGRQRERGRAAAAARRGLARVRREAPRAAAAGTTGRRSGRRRPCARVEPGELRVVGEDQPDRGRRGRAGGVERARDEPREAGVPATSATPPTTDVDPPLADRSVGHAHERGRASAGATPALAAGRGAPRLELDDLVLRVRDPLVVHAQQLRHERLADPLDVAQRQVALVELAVRSRSSMIRATIARIAASSRDASERTDASTLSASMMIAASRGLRLRAGVAEPALVDRLGRLARPPRSRARRTAPPPSSRARA